MRFRCSSCSHITDSRLLAPSCEGCGGAVLLEESDGRRVSAAELEGLPPGVWRYRGLLEGVAAEDPVTLGEGGTPLLRAESLGAELGLRNLLVKDESRNPTGSFMDRGATVLVSVAKGRSVRECSCDTTGNLGASLAAYCAKASIRARIHVSPNTDQGKLYQMLAYGAELSSTSALPVASALAVTAANPFLLEGEKTTGFEIVQDLGWQEPDVIVVPVGTGGHLSMIWRSVGALRRAGLAGKRRCRIMGVELGEPAQRTPGTKKPPEYFPLAELADSLPFYRKTAAASVRESKGTLLKATPEETIAATSLLAKSEGIFAEPSSASVVAALMWAAKEGLVGSSETVVCVITGAGLKDPRSVSRVARETRRVGRQTFAAPSVKIGETKLAVLRSLRHRPGYAYELWRALRARRRMSTASVYQHLLELEEYGMIRKRGSVVSGGRERIMYELTRKGAEYLRITAELEESQDRF